MSFELHPNLSKKTFILDLPLSRVLLENNAYYPWIFLIPRRPEVSRIMQLTVDDQQQLLQEIDMAQNVMWELFHPTQLNVAAIGNKTPQLHVHVIARRDSDPAWPGTVWDHPAKLPYSDEQKNQIVDQLKQAFTKKINGE